jgi:hypothetical protein
MEQTVKISLTKVCLFLVFKTDFCVQVRIPAKKNNNITKETPLNANNEGYTQQKTPFGKNEPKC